MRTNKLKYSDKDISKIITEIEINGTNLMDLPSSFENLELIYAEITKRKGKIRGILS